jgi:uncharacterized protein (TIGR02266 family)
MGEKSRTGGAERRVDPRAPLRTEVRISYPDPERLVAKICANVSIGGMYVEMPAPPEVGTVVRFELDLAALRGFIRGVGEVIWRAPESGARGELPGFGMRFVELDAIYRQLIFRVVDRFIQNGGQPFDLDRGS